MGKLNKYFLDNGAKSYEFRIMGEIQDIYKSTLDGSTYLNG